MTQVIYTPTEFEPDLEALPDDELIMLGEELIRQIGRVTTTANMLLSSPRVSISFRRTLNRLRLEAAFIKGDVEEAMKRAEKAAGST